MSTNDFSNYFNYDSKVINDSLEFHTNYTYSHLKVNAILIYMFDSNLAIEKLYFQHSSKPNNNLSFFILLFHLLSLHMVYLN